MIGDRYRPEGRPSAVALSRCLDAIRAGCTTRMEVASRLGIDYRSASARVSALLADGLVLEDDELRVAQGVAASEVPDPPTPGVTTRHGDGDAVERPAPPVASSASGAASDGDTGSDAGSDAIRAGLACQAERERQGWFRRDLARRVATITGRALGTCEVYVGVHERGQHVARWFTDALPAALAGGGNAP